MFNLDDVLIPGVKEDLPNKEADDDDKSFETPSQQDDDSINSLEDIDQQDDNSITSFEDINEDKLKQIQDLAGKPVEAGGDTDEPQYQQQTVKDDRQTQENQTFLQSEDP